MKIRKLITGTIILAITLSYIVIAQQPALTKEQIIERSWEAMFGQVSSKKIRTIYFESYFHGREEPSRIYLKRPNLFRNESSDAILVFDGGKAAMITEAEEGKELDKTEIVDSTYWAHFEVDIALIFPAFFEYPSEYRGINSADSDITYEIFVDLPLGGNVSYFIDPETFLVRRRLVSWEGDPDKELWENLITGYNDYNGLLFEEGYSFIGHEGREKGYFRNVKYNREFNKSLFEIKFR